MKRPQLYLDDLKAGQIFKSDSYTVSKEEIIAFATQFDPQVFHLDEEAAKSTMFKGLSASGIHTFGIMMRLLAGSPFYLANGLISTGGDVRWKKPVRAGDTLRLEIEIKAIDLSSKPDRGTVAVHVETINQDGETVHTFDSGLMGLKRPANTASANA